jgi:glycosyltransferase involved in cell wall biosynthesis
MPSFRAAVEALRDSFELLTGDRPEPCAERAGWYHHYFCPEHGRALAFDSRSPRAHRCPAAGGHSLTGDPFDAAWRWFMNDRLSLAAYRAALLWHLTDDAEGRRHAGDILTSYAIQYPHYPVDEAPKAGRATRQSLDEAVWLIPLMWAHCLIRDDLEPPQAARIESQLLVPASEHIASKLLGTVHNIECWHLAALVTAGAVLGCTRWTTEGTRGLGEQLDHGVLDDGFWFEGSPSYHYYATWAFAWAARASEEIRSHPKLPRMLEAPLWLAFPDGTLPALNDCWFHASLQGELVHGAPEVDSFYEVASGWFDNPLFTRLLSFAYRTKPRSSVEALLYGPDTIRDETEPFPTQSRVLLASGYAVLRSGAAPEESMQLVLKCGPHGGPHGHPDKLSFSLWAFGQGISLDLGNGGYGDRDGSLWYRSTLAHNTVVVDGKSQPPATGELRDFRGSREGDFGIIDAAVEWRDGSYRGVNLRRLLLHHDDYVIDVVACEADSPRQFELVQRFAGQCAPPDASDEPVEHLGPLKDVRRRTGARGRPLRVVTPGPLLVDYFVLEPHTELLLGRAPSNPRSSWDEIVLRRHVGKETWFAALIHIRRASTPALHVELLEGGRQQARLSVRRGDTIDHWNVSLSQSTVALTVDGPRSPPTASRTDHSTARYSGESGPAVAYLPTPPAGDARHYLGLLRGALAKAGVDVRDLPRVLTRDWLQKNAGRCRILHQHFPAYAYTQGATSHDEVRARLQEWEEGLKHARSLGYAIVWTAHNLYPHDTPHRDLDHRGRLTLLKYATGVIAHCQYAAAEIRRRFGGEAEIVVIPHPHYRDCYLEPLPREEARELLELPREGPLYLNLGLIRPYKGHEKLIRSFSVLQDPRARLLIVGRPSGTLATESGDLTDRLRNVAASDPRIILRPVHVPHAMMPAYFGACDFVVLAYVDVLTSGAVMMAQTMERAVIAPSLGCLPEMIPAGTGLLYDPSRDDGLAVALFDARNMDRSAGRQAWERVRYLDWPSTAAATRELYRRAAQRAALPRGARE